MKKILVIEDEPFIRASIKEILKIKGYSVIEAIDGREGKQLALTQDPDLILCDVMMPHIDGYELLRQLRGEKGFNTPVIFLTALAQSNDVDKGLALGAVDYVFKPFKVAELTRAVKKVLMD